MRKKRRYLGCLVIFLFIPVCCYGLLFAYARLAGDWASSQVLPPLPDESQLILEHESNAGGYINRLNFYSIRGDLDEIQNSIPLMMYPVTEEGTDVVGYLSSIIYAPDLVARPENDLPLFYVYLAGLLTTWGKGESYDTVPGCFFIRLYQSAAFMNTSFYREYFENIAFTPSDDMVIAITRRCYPSW